MLSRSLCVCLIGVAAALFPGVALAQDPAYVPAEVLLAFAESTPESTKAAVLDDLGATVLHYFTLIDAYHLHVANKSTEQAVGEYEGHPALRYIEPNYYGQAHALVPDDDFFAEQWALNNVGQFGGTADADIDAPEAWELFTDASAVRVFVIDTGAKLDHEDLQDNLNLELGYDFLDGDSDPTDTNGHGTHIAGIVAAVANNDEGVAGVAWRAEIVPLRFYTADEPPDATVARCVQSYEYAIQHEAQIIVLSWGVQNSRPETLRLIMEVADNLSIISVVSAGNENWNMEDPTRRVYPACFPFDSIISVAATNRRDHRWYTGTPTAGEGSNWSPVRVDLGAPGYAILSTCIDDPPPQYCLKTGTSMAAPVVAGALALVMANNPWLTPLEAKNQILANVDPLPAWADTVLSGGRLNLHKALAAYEVVVFPNGGERLVAGGVVTLAWSQARTTAVDAVDIWLLRDGQADVLIAAGEPNDGHYEWNIGANTVGEAARIKLVSHNVHSPVLGQDLSNAPFLIIETFPVNYVNRTTESELDYDGTPYSSVAFDYSGDKKPDLFISIKEAEFGGQLFQRWDIVNNNARFVNRTDYDFHAGDEPPGGLRGLAVASYDDDKALELFAAHNTTPRLYDMDVALGQFRDKASATGVLANAQNSWAGAWGDYDGDRLVDLYVCRAAYDGQDPLPGNVSPLADALLWNQVPFAGQFVPQSFPTGPSSASIAAAWEDVDGVNGPDIFVADLRAAGGAETYPKLYIRQSDGSFADEFTTRFTVDPQLIHSCTSVEWADVNRDGEPDLVLGNTTNEAWVFMNNGAGDFHGEPVLVPAGGPTTGVKVYDADLDGWQDVLCLPRNAGLPAKLWVNARSQDGCRQVDVTTASGLAAFTGRVDGATTVSYDNDRVPDLYLGKAMTTGNVYLKGNKRIEPFPGGDVAVHLYGYANNGGSIGAKAVFTVGGAEVVRTVDGGSGRGTQRDLVVSCGIGEEAGPIQTEITWPSGFTRAVSVPRDSVLAVCDEGAAPEVPLASVTATHQPKPGGLTDWIFTWDTTYRSDADKDLVTIVDAPGSPGQCLLNQTVELRPEDPGVEATMTAKVGGGYEHKITWKDRPCVPNCTYNYKVASATECDQSEPMSSWKQLRIRVCAQ